MLTSLRPSVSPNLPVTPKQSSPELSAPAMATPPDRIELRFSGQPSRAWILWPEVPDEMITELRKPKPYQIYSRFRIHEDPVDNQFTPSKITRNDWIVYNRIFNMGREALQQAYQPENHRPKAYATREFFNTWHDDLKVADRRHLALAIGAIQDDDLKEQWIDFMIRDPDEEVRYQTAQQFATLSNQTLRDRKAEELLMSADPIVRAGCLVKAEAISPRLRWRWLTETIDWHTQQPGIHTELFSTCIDATDSFETNVNLRKWASDRYITGRIQHLLDSYHPRQQQEPHKRNGTKHMATVEETHGWLHNLHGAQYNEMLAKIQALAADRHAPAQPLAQDVLLMQTYFQTLAEMPKVEEGSHRWEQWLTTLRALPEQATTAAKPNFEQLRSRFNQYADECATSEKARADVRMQGRSGALALYHHDSDDREWTPEAIQAFENHLPS